MTLKVVPVAEAVKAQGALRAEAGLGPEVFPLAAFVAMISDEVEGLRRRGRTDAEIAATIERNSAIQISADDIAAYYASPAERGHHGE